MLYHPIQEISYLHDGTKIRKPVNVKQSMSDLADGFVLLQEARQVAHMDLAYEKTLTSAEMDTALDHLKKMFLEHACVNVTLQRRIYELKENPDKVSTKDKKR